MNSVATSFKQANKFLTLCGISKATWSEAPPISREPTVVTVYTVLLVVVSFKLAPCSSSWLAPSPAAGSGGEV